MCDGLFLGKGKTEEGSRLCHREQLRVEQDRGLEAGRLKVCRRKWFLFSPCPWGRPWRACPCPTPQRTPRSPSGSAEGILDQYSGDTENSPEREKCWRTPQRRGSCSSRPPSSSACSRSRSPGRTADCWRWLYCTRNDAFGQRQKLVLKYLFLLCLFCVMTLMRKEYFMFLPWSWYSIVLKGLFYDPPLTLT